MTERDESNLALHMERRRLELRLSWEEIASRARISAGHLRRIRKGESGVSTIVRARLEEVLQWQPGSIQAVIEGCDPTPADKQPTIELVQSGGSTITVEVPAALSEEGRRYLIERARRIAQQLLDMEESPHTEHSRG